MESYKEIINGETPVLIDFHATWCGPCKMMSPIIEEVGKELKGKVRILKIDIDKNQKLANEYHIQAVPTFILFKEGEIAWRNSGAMDKQKLLSHLNAFLKV